MVAAVMLRGKLILFCLYALAMVAILGITALRKSITYAIFNRPWCCALIQKPMRVAHDPLSASRSTLLRLTQGRADRGPATPTRATLARVGHAHSSQAAGLAFPGKLTET